MKQKQKNKSGRLALTARRTATAAAVAACFSGAIFIGEVQANPANPTVVHGTANFSTAGNILNITNSPNAIINWGSFSIGVNELTRFIQQSSSSAVLNRVIGQDPSAILGALQSNGRVFLLNPNGIVFGASSQINVAGLVASTLRLSDDDFLNNRMKFTDGAGAGSVVNQGSITGGSVYLIGKAVSNDGLITSPNGEVILAAGNSVELVNPGTPNLRVEIVAPDNEAKNLGSITADAGRIGIYAGLIQQGGTLRADSAVVEGGRILLKATKNVHLAAASQTSASGVSGGRIDIQAGDTTIVEGDIAASGSTGAGGTVQVLGNLVGLVGHANIDASGDTGGGTVLVGGDYQGKNPDVQNAFRTFVGPDVTINADAITGGDGGKVVVWADDITRFYGNISARGGANGGDGGFAEVSGKRVLDFQGTANLGAAHGATGTLLLDPENIDIDATTGLVSGLLEILLGTLGAGTLTDGELLFGEASSSTIAIHPTVLNNSTAHIILQANEDINVNDAIFLSNNGVSITMEAGGYLNVNNSITTRGGEITLVAGAPGSLTSPNEGGLYVNAGLDTTGAGAVSAGADIRLTSYISNLDPESVFVGAPVNAGSAGNVILLNTSGSILQNASGVITAHGLAATATNGDVILNAANNQVDHFAAFAGDAVVDTDRQVLFKNTRNLSLETVDTVTGITATSTSYSGSVNIDLGANHLIGGSGQVIAVQGDSASLISVNAASIGEIGGQFLEVNPGAGMVSLTAATGGVAVKQVAGNLLTSRYALSALSGQKVSLASSGGSMQVNGSLSYSGNDLELITTGANDIQFNAGAPSTITANSLTLAPASGRSVVFTSGVTPWDISAPVSVLNNALLDVNGGQTVNFNNLFSTTGAINVGTGSTLNLSGGATLSSLTTAGTVLGGALDVDSLTQTNGSIAVSALTVNNSFLQTGTSTITGTSGDVKLNQASGNLAVKSAFAYGKFKAVAASGDVILTGASVSTQNGPVEIHASGNIDINGGSYINAGSQSPSNIQMVATGGGVTIQNSSVNASYGGPIDITAATGITVSSSTQSTSIVSTGNVTLTSGGNVNVLGGSGGSQAAVISGGIVTIDASGDVMITGGGGASSYAEVYAADDIFMTVGGTVHLDDGIGAGSTAKVVAGSPTSVHLHFANLASGGYFVNGTEGAITDAVTGSGFYAGGSPVLPAILDSSLIVTYGLTAPGGGSSGNLEGSLDIPTQTLIVATGKSTEAPESKKDNDVFKEAEEDGKKDAPVCK